MVSASQRLKLQFCEYQNSLNDFVAEWLHHYKEVVARIDLFNPELTKSLSLEQQKLLVKALYHTRGHCNDFFWFVANHGSRAMKELILDNTAEEFGRDGKSHEQLYHDFAESLGIDLTDEVVNETTYLPFVREYNRSHLRWLAAHDADSHLAAFSAYEKLDNPDYTNLYELAKSLGIQGRGLVFFDVHRHVEHYEATMHFVDQVWKKSPEKVREAFTFIAEHQIDMWQQLSDVVFSGATERTICPAQQA
jgi:pyrroloquinoline quinone (PQQ) biosynthesis protein C